jgi:hypothetical protein
MPYEQQKEHLVQPPSIVKLDAETKSSDFESI